MIKNLIVTMTLVLIFRSNLWAESLKLKNGLTVKGKIVNQDKDRLQLETDVGVTLTYYLDEIEKIQKDTLLKVQDAAPPAVQPKPVSFPIFADPNNMPNQTNLPSIAPKVIATQKIDYLDFGSNQYNQGQYVNAIESFKKAIAEDPNQADTYYRIGTSYGAMGDIDKATVAFEKAVELNPTNAEFWFNLGMAYGKNGNIPKSQQALEKTIELNSTHADAWYHLGIGYSISGDNNKARQALETAVTLNPKSADGFFNLGLTYAALKEYQKAEESLKKVIEIDPNYAQAYYNLGIAQGVLGDKEEAIKNLTKANELLKTANDPALMNQIGEAMKKTNMKLF